jgi:hypothetical protein
LVVSRADPYVSANIREIGRGKQIEDRGAEVRKGAETRGRKERGREREEEIHGSA